MTDLHEPKVADPYEVLGVSPNDSAEEIESAFNRLIEGGGYREGVPLRGQWQRAREIKQAYAIIGDPDKRRAYDQTLARVSGPLWPAPANDPATEALVRRVQKQPRPRFAPQDADAHGPAHSEALPAPQIHRAAEDKVAPLRKKGPARSRKGSKKEQVQLPEGSSPTVLEPAPSSSEPEQALAEAIESGRDDAVPTPEDVRLNDHKRRGAKSWGSATAAALALGLLVYFARPGGEPQLSGPKTAAPSAPEQAVLGAPKPGSLAQLPHIVPSSEKEAGAPSVPIPPPIGLGTFVHTPGAVAGDVPTGTHAAIETRNQSRAAVTASSATATSEAPPSGQGSTAGPPAAATAPARVLVGPEPAASASSKPTVGGAEARPSVAAGAADSAVRVQSQWLSGGPTAKDNRRGRYKGTVIVQFTVRPDGRAANCRTVRASGDANLDALTCRLVEDRSRFSPALDAQGRAVASEAHATYEWGRRHRPSIRTVLSKIF